MKLNKILIAGCAISFASSLVLAGNDKYVHTHKGTAAEAQNKDTNFGSPANYDRHNHYRNNYELQISTAGVDSPKKLSVEQRAVANFDIRNTSDSDLILVVGDDNATKETADLLSAGKPEEPFNFHSIQIKAGQRSQMAWNFDTYATRQVKFSVMNMKGQLAKKVLTINVGPLEDRNAQFAGH